MRKQSIIIISAILCAAIICAAGAMKVMSLVRESADETEEAVVAAEQMVIQPDELTTGFFQMVNEGQYDQLYEMLSEQSREMISADDFSSKYRNIYEGIAAENITIKVNYISDYKPDPAAVNNNSDGNTAAAGLAGERKVVGYALQMDTIAGEINYNNEAVFQLNNDNEYKAEWSTGWIFPLLREDDKVRVSTLKAKRGNLYDRNGEMLAGEGVASVVGFVPGKMSQDEAEKDIARAAELLELTPESITSKLSASYVKEDTLVTLRTVSKDADELKQELLTIPGILISDTTVRTYPLAEKASHLTGYIQNINAEELALLSEQGYNAQSILGKTGLEKIYEDQLRAVDGYEVNIVDLQGEPRITMARKDKKDGEDIYLTIDARLQTALYDLFSADKSCSVAMNPVTGEVLALVSTPTYDANDFVLGMSGSRFTALNEDPNFPFLNRFKAALCPGSTMKAITAAIAIETGAVSPGEDLGRSGKRWQKDGSWGGYHVTTTMEYDGPADIENGLKFSDNIYFAKVGLRIGADRFASELMKLGFEDRIPFEYGLYSSIISTTESFESEIQLADSSFGQGQVLTNPIHLAAVYSAFINEGSMIQPYLIKTEQPSSRFWKPDAFSPETAATVRNSLIQVIESGSATDAKVPGRTLGGKTGTAEIKQSQNDQNGTELGWFVEFTADADEANPLLILSMVEDVKGRGSSHYLSPKIKTLFE